MEEINGKTRYGRICKMLVPIVGQKMTLVKLQRHVMINIGSSPAVLKESVQLMLDLGLVKETSHMVFKVLKSEAEL